jgi:hypothetical protein
MDKHEVEVQVTLQSGTYWLGDPCYIIKDEDWTPWLEACNFRNQDTLVGTVPGKEIQACGFRTAYGDGVYDFEGRNHQSWKHDEWETIAQLGVDSGMIGFVESVDTKPQEGTENMVMKVTFEHPVTITARDGNLSWITSRGESFRVNTEDEDYGDW